MPPKMGLERVARCSLSKLKSVLVTDSHAQLLQRPCSATYGHEQRRRRLPSSSGDALPEGWTVNSVRVVPSAPGRRCPPTYCQELGAIHLLATCWCAPTFLAQVLVPVGRQPAARQGFARNGEQAAHRPVRSGLALGSGAIRLGWQAGSGSSGFGHRFGGVGRKKHAHMHTCTCTCACCIQTATQHVTTHRHAVTRPCPRALSSLVSARARPLCLLPSVLQSGRRRGSRRAAAATSPTRTDLPRPRRWRGRACTAGAGPRGREGRRARRARERRRRRLARAGLRGVGRGTTCSGRSARSAQLGDDEGDHAARSASRGQEPTPSSPPGRRIETSLRRKRVRGGGSRRACGARASGVEDRDEPAAQSRPGWSPETSLRRASVPAARGSGGCTGGRA